MRCSLIGCPKVLTLDALVYEERLAVGEAEGLLVLHHGRGTDERDLLGLADALDPRRRLHVVSPRAPLAENLIVMLANRFS